MKKNVTFFLIFLFSISGFNTIYSQEYSERLLECGNNRLIDESDENKLACTYNTDCYGLAGRDCDPPSDPCGKMRIPIAVSIITDGAGGGAINQADLDANLAEVNAMYADANMEFFECVPRRNIDDADLYDFDDDDATSCAAMGADDDDDQLDPLDVPGVINLYFVEDPERCGNVVCGYAPYPGNTSMHSVMNNSCIGSGESTLAHELGHYFGLYHTHAGNSNTSAPINNSSDCCTTGDQICDTGADPKSNTDPAAMAQCLFSVNNGCDCYTTPPNNMANCANGLGNCEYNGPTGATGYNPDVGNIMSYNPWGGCVRDHFSPCQLAKMYDVLFDCRMDLCCVPDPPTASDPATICYGDPLANLTADILGNDNRTKENNCVTWYSDAAGTNVLSNQTPSYQPVYGNGTGEISGPGTYTYYVADVGIYNPGCSSDLTEITVIVEACCVDVVERDDTVTDCEDVTADITGWKNTVQATDGTGAVDSAPDGAVFEDIIYSTDNMAAIAAANPPAAEPAYVWDAATAGDNCSSITQTVYAYVRCDLNNDGFANPPGTDDTYTLAGTMNLTIHAPPMEPTITLSETCTAGTVGECAYQVNFVCAADTESATSVDASTENDGYAGNATESVTIETADGCMETFMIEKPACSCCSATVVLADNPTEVCDTETMVDICVDVTAGDASEVTIDVDGIMAIGTTGAAQVCVALAVDVFNTCAPNPQAYTVSATCIGGSQILASTPAMLTVYPTYTTSITNDADCGDISISLNYGAMTCSTAMLACTNTEELNVNFGMLPDADTNPITNQVNDPLGCSVLTASTTCMGCIVCTSTSAVSADNLTETCTGASATVDICVDVTSGDATEVTIDVDGIMATGAAGATQVCAAISLNTNTGCAPIDQTYTVSAVCNDNSELIPPTQGSITIYPILATTVVDDGSSCETLQIDLTDADGNACQSATINCALDGDALSVDFGAAPDPATNPINAQINDPLGCSTLTNASATCSGCPCPPKSSDAGNLNGN